MAHAGIMAQGIAPIMMFYLQRKMKTTLYLIRHGETEWNASSRWQGHADVPLNDVGHEQAALLAKWFRRTRVRFDRMYSSDLSRAYQTAWAIGSALSMPVQLYPPLREIDLGIWSGMTRDEVRERYPIEFALLDQGQDIPRGGAETTAALTKRVVGAVRALIAQHPGETLALVSHGGSLRTLLKQGATDEQRAHVRWRNLANTSVSVMHVTEDRWELESFNDVTHLERGADHDELVTVPPDDAQPPTEGFA